MIPLFGDDLRRRRQINLGGSSSASSQSAILDQARARRLEREEQRRRQESAVKIQACWRGYVGRRRVRLMMTERFEEDVTGITGLRCLMLVRRDGALLARWSSTMLQCGHETLLQPARGPDRTSWQVLICQTSLLMLRAVAANPQSEHAVSHLQILTYLLDSAGVSQVLDSAGPQVSIMIAEYLLSHNLYGYLSNAFSGVNVESKSTPSLPYIVTLISLPLRLFADSASTSIASSLLYTRCVYEIIRHILTIPLLPNRLPLQSLSTLSANLPLSAIHLLSNSPSMLPSTTSTSSPSQWLSPHSISSLISETSLLEKLHLLANLLAFTPPRYTSLSSHDSSPFRGYLDLLGELLGSFPVRALEGKPASTATSLSTSKSWVDDDSDMDVDVETDLAPFANLSSINSPTSLPVLDTRTLRRLEVLPSPTHLTALLRAVQAHHTSGLVSPLLPPLVPVLLNLCTVWPERRDKILGTILAFGSSSTGGSGMLRELYRGCIRGSALGTDEGIGLSGLMDSSHASTWPPLLLLVDLFTQSLLTMGDDEFFSSEGGNSRSGLSISLDELIAFSRRLLNIAFVLYWREDQTNGSASIKTGGISVGSVVESGSRLEGGVPGVNMRWELAREKITRFLQAVHARDSRKPFTPTSHWHVSSQIDMTSFVEAAVIESEHLSRSESTVFSASSRPLSKRQVAYIAPRLAVLHNIPFAIPFEVRVSIFRTFVMADMVSRGVDRYRDRTRVSVRRGNVAQDGFDKLSEVNLKSSIEITFIDQWGQPEAGIDGGGVFKEFFTSLCKEVFDTDRGLWLANKKNELYPNPHSYATEPHSLSWYRFIGRILGKAIYEGILVDVAFAGFFLAKWLGKQSFLDDLSSLDPDLYQGLIFLKKYAGNPEDLSLNFTVAIEEFGVAKTFDLIPNGSNIAVTRENRLQYIYLVSHYRLSKQIKLQSEAFFEGLSEMIDPKWLRMFNQQEVQILLGGVNSPVDLQDLRENTNYGGLYSDDEPTIQAFWNVAESFDQEQRRALLRFVTSCSRPPLLGFKELVPKFAIRDAGNDQNRLPTSSTCVNLLKLPRYKDEITLRGKLLQAIYSGAGFDLS